VALKTAGYGSLVVLKRSISLERVLKMARFCLHTFVVYCLNWQVF